MDKLGVSKTRSDLFSGTDIIMCNSENCPNRQKCYRANALPTFAQEYYDFYSEYRTEFDIAPKCFDPIQPGDVLRDTNWRDYI